MKYPEAKDALKGKEVTIHREGLEDPLLAKVKVKDVIPPISERSESYGIKYGEGNILSGITPDDQITVR